MKRKLVDKKEETVPVEEKPKEEKLKEEKTEENPEEVPKEEPVEINRMDDTCPAALLAEKLYC